jgi:hypothetical protein
MVLIIMAIFAVLFFISMNYISNNKLRNLASVVTFVVFALALVGGIANFHSHLGMKTQTVTTKQTVYSVSPSKELQFIIYQPVGTDGKTQAVVYKADEHAKKTTVAKPALDTKNLIKKTSADHASLVVKKTEKVYKNEFWKVLFGIAGNNKMVTKKVNTFYVPKSWESFSANQVKKLQSLQKEMNSKAGKAKVKKEAESFIGDKVKADMMALGAKAQSGDAEAAATMMDPTKQAQLQKDLVAKYTKQFQEQVMKKMMDEVKKTK